MRLLTDPQPAIEWFCTGGSVCIGTEGDDRHDSETARDPRTRSAATLKRPVRFPAAKGEV
jgi:hypothetical protein